MSEGSKRKPPSLLDDTKDDTTDNTNALYQLQMLTEFMAKEFLDLKPEKMSKLLEEFEIENHPERIRELYDFVIESIDVTPNKKKARLHLGKMVNIFNAYSGITPDKRAFETAIGVKAFKAVGEYYEDGSYRKYARLTPAEPTSPTVQTPFPPTGGQADARGIVSYDSARGGRESTMAQVQADFY